MTYNRIYLKPTGGHPSWASKWNKEGLYLSTACTGPASIAGTFTQTFAGDPELGWLTNYPPIPNESQEAARYRLGYEEPHGHNSTVGIFASETANPCVYIRNGWIIKKSYAFWVFGTTRGGFHPPKAPETGESHMIASTLVQTYGQAEIVPRSYPVSGRGRVNLTLRLIGASHGEERKEKSLRMVDVYRSDAGGSGYGYGDQPVSWAGWSRAPSTVQCARLELPVHMKNGGIIFFGVQAELSVMFTVGSNLQSMGYFSKYIGGTPEAHWLHFIDLGNISIDYAGAINDPDLLSIPEPTGKTISLKSPTGDDAKNVSTPVTLEWDDKNNDYNTYEVQVWPSTVQVSPSEPFLVPGHHHLTPGQFQHSEGYDANDEDPESPESLFEETTDIHVGGVQGLVHKLTGCKWTTPKLEPNMTYYWRVRPKVQPRIKGAKYGPVPWSDTWTFQTK